jgi:hypothetical protein
MVNEVKSQIPILSPVMVVIPASTTQTISFPNEYLGRAVSLLISNLDATNVATYQIGGNSMPTLTLSTGAFRSIDDTNISLIKVVSGSAGAVQVEAQVQLFAGLK